MGWFDWVPGVGSSTDYDREFVATCREIADVGETTFLRASDLNAIAEALDIKAVFVHRPPKHWALLTGMEEEALIVYDPLQGRDAIRRQNKPEMITGGNYTLYITAPLKRELQAIIAESGEEDRYNAGMEGRFENPEEVLYRLNYTAADAPKKPVQIDEYNCGPLAVWAAAESTVDLPGTLPDIRL